MIVDKTSAHDRLIARAALLSEGGSVYRNSDPFDAFIKFFEDRKIVAIKAVRQVADDFDLKTSKEWVEAVYNDQERAAERRLNRIRSCASDVRNAEVLAIEANRHGLAARLAILAEDISLL